MNESVPEVKASGILFPPPPLHLTDIVEKISVVTWW